MKESNRNPSAAVDGPNPLSLAVPHRRTVNFELNETDIADLMNQTSFDRAQILAWHIDFLVGDRQS